MQRDFHKEKPQFSFIFCALRQLTTNLSTVSAMSAAIFHLFQTTLLKVNILIPSLLTAPLPFKKSTLNLFKYASIALSALL